MTEQHKFEAANLGKAPFRFIGFYQAKFQAMPGAPIRAGASCDYCGTAIMDCFKCVSSDGHEFKVGSDCIRKVGDHGLIKHVDKIKREASAKKRGEKKVFVGETLRALLAEMKPRLERMPHPFAGYAAQGKTMYDSVMNRYNSSGAAGRERLLKELSALPDE